MDNKHRKLFIKQSEGCKCANLCLKCAPPEPLAAVGGLLLKGGEGTEGRREGKENEGEGITRKVKVSRINTVDHV